MSQLSVVQQLKPKTAIEKKTKTVVDTIMVTPELLNKWISPPFQRPLRENDKVRALAEQLKVDGGVLPGIITLGILDGETYILDGQHRKAAFLISGLREGFTDIRKHFFDNMGDMGEEFVLLNSSLVRMRPDDILRGLESSIPSLAHIREKASFVGYDFMRSHNAAAPMASMSAVLRQWFGSSTETPNGSAMSTVELAKALTMEESNTLIDFLGIAISAFGRDVENFRLWGGLNLCICMWLYRNIVLKEYSKKTPQFSKDQFRKCLLSLSADSNYLDWLVGRKLGERDRSPAYSRIKAIFIKRIAMDNGGVRIPLPQPAWQHSGHVERFK